MTISPHRRRFGFCFNMLGDNAEFSGRYGDVTFLERIQKKDRGSTDDSLGRNSDSSGSSSQAILKQPSDNRRGTVSSLRTDLNPVDKVWFYVKFDRLPNLAPPRLSDLRVHVQAESYRLQHRPDVLKSLFNLTKLSSDCKGIPSRR